MISLIFLDQFLLLKSIRKMFLPYLVRFLDNFGIQLILSFDLLLIFF